MKKKNEHDKTHLLILLCSQRWQMSVQRVPSQIEFWKCLGTPPLKEFKS